MKPRHMFGRILGLSIVCSACLWFLMHNIPSAPAQDSTQKKEIVAEIDNKTEDFTDPFALYRRSAISPALRDVQSNIPDQPGAVQLMPIGSLTPFVTDTQRLPKKVTEMGVVALGKYIYVIGGNIRQSGEEQPERSDEVFVGEVNQQTGAVTWEWDSKNFLPAVRFSNIDTVDGYDEKIAKVSFMASTAVETEDNSGYIYVIGGIVSPKAFNKQVSSAAVHIGVVQDGAIVKWKEGPMLTNPDPRVPEGTSYGIESAAATHVRIGGRTFVYIFGGKHVSYNPDSDDDKEKIDPVNFVFYAEVDEATGNLLKPGTTQQGWKLVSSIPTPDDAKAPGAMGLWFTTVVQGAAGNSTNNYAIYLIGGQRRLQKVPAEEDPHKYSNVVYRARVSDEGKLTWDWQGLLPGSPLYNMSGTQFNGNIYVTGGIPFSGSELSVQPRKDVMYSYINDDLTLLDGADSFITVPEDDVERGALPLARAKHGTVVVPSVNPEKPGTLAYVYVIGGVSGTGDDVDPDDDHSYNGTDTVFFSRVDPEEAEKIYPADGWYYSRLHNVETYLLENKTTLTGVYWSALISRTEAISTDIRLEYRIDTKPEGCRASQLFENGEMPWTPLVITDELSSTQSITRTFKGNGSQFGPNDADLADAHINSAASCMQYRAQLIRDEEDLTHTPVLLNVGVQFIADKRPNLYIDRIDPQFLGSGEESQKLVGLDLTVKNLNGDMVNTADANFDGGDENYIFLDLFILAPGELGILEDMQDTLKDSVPVFGSEAISVPSTLHLWNTIPKDVMVAGETYPNDQRLWPSWKYVDDPDGPGELKAGDGVKLTDALADIGKTGTYTVCLAIDSFVNKNANGDESVQWPNGYVNEAIETDNAKCQRIDVEQPPIEVWVVPEDADAGEDAEVTEDGTIEGTFVITREGGSLILPLTVTFQLEGNATFGDPTQTDTGDGSAAYDYELTFAEDVVHAHGLDAITKKTKFTVTIPADKESITIRVAPYDDTIYDPDEKVRLKLLAEDDARYGLVGSDDKPDEAVVTIKDNDPMGIYLPLILK